MKTRDDLIKEKIDNLKNNKNISDKDIMGDVIGSYAKVKNKGRCYFMYKKPYDYVNSEQYKSNREKFPSYSPGPEHYWKMKDLKKSKKKKKYMENQEKFILWTIKELILENLNLWEKACFKII